MHLPRWSLVTAAVAIALPLAGPAIATAATDGDVPVLSALTAAFTSGECEDGGEPALASEEDPAVFAELSDTPEQGEDACEDEDVSEDPVTDPDQPADDELDDDLREDPNPGDSTDDSLIDGDLADDEITNDDTAPEAEQLRHGALVSTVARCAPRGRDASELFGQRNHGAFVSAAAHGSELDVLGETFDLSTLEGAEALCAFIADPPEPETEQPEVGTQATEEQDTVEETDRVAGSRPTTGTPPGKAERAAKPGTASGQGGGATDVKSGEGGGPPASRPARAGDGGGHGGANGNGGGPPAHAGKGGPNR